MTKQERQSFVQFLRKSLQKEVDRRIFRDLAIANDIDVEMVLREHDEMKEEDE